MICLSFASLELVVIYFSDDSIYSMIEMNPVINEGLDTLHCEYTAALPPKPTVNTESARNFKVIII